MTATEPTQPRPTAGTYVEPSGMNAAETAVARPDQWGALPTAESHIVPHTAFDELQNWDGGGPSSLADDCYGSTLD